MIKYERAWNKLHPNMVGMAVEKTEKDFIHFLLQKQIDEDNKRFLEYVGEDEDESKHAEADEYWPLGRNELRQELRDKVNKK